MAPRRPHRASPMGRFEVFLCVRQHWLQHHGGWRSSLTKSGGKQPVCQLMIGQVSVESLRLFTRRISRLPIVCAIACGEYTSVLMERAFQRLAHSTMRHQFIMYNLERVSTAEMHREFGWAPR